jgi:DNA adenine methylase
LIEPFAGGAVVSLTAVMEDLVQQSILSELDTSVAAFWQAALYYNEDLRGCITKFVPTRERVEALQSSNPQTVLEKGFRTLVLNRTRRGGILAKGASLPGRAKTAKG